MSHQSRHHHQQFDLKFLLRHDKVQRYRGNTMLRLAQSLYKDQPVNFLCTQTKKECTLNPFHDLKSSKRHPERLGVIIGQS